MTIVLSGVAQSTRQLKVVTVVVGELTIVAPFGGARSVIVGGAAPAVGAVERNTPATRAMTRAARGIEVLIGRSAARKMPRSGELSSAAGARGGEREANEGRLRPELGRAEQCERLRRDPVPG